jgi:ApbE superfamily uncharacterized protein (UPF0280 family)
MPQGLHPPGHGTGAVKTQLYVPRFYRERTSPPGGRASFNVLYRDTDLWIAADPGLEPLARARVLELRAELESYIARRREFLTSLEPLPDDGSAPDIAREMIAAARLAGVGPMAAVAGAVAEAVGRELLGHSPDVIVENGGDIFIKTSGPFLTGVFAGDSPFSGKIGYDVETSGQPLGLCTSSGTVGHSLSFGRADAVTILSQTAALADAFATAVGNIVKARGDIEAGLAYARDHKEIKGCGIIVGDGIGLYGDLRLVKL